tara:strand:+ start:485 stop:1021 length:537 start_codon:yes stop_codon:yes gene_type:complete
MTETENYKLVADFLTFNESILDEIKSESKDLYKAVNEVINQLMFEEVKIYAFEPTLPQFKANDLVVPTDKKLYAFYGVLTVVPLKSNPIIKKNRVNTKDSYYYTLDDKDGSRINFYEEELELANNIGQYSDKSARELKIIMDELKEFIQLIDDPNDADVVNSELSIDEIEQELFNRKN